MFDAGREGAAGTHVLPRPPRQFVRPEPMFVRQTSGHFSRPKERFIVRHYRYFLRFPNKNPENATFGKKTFNHETH